MKRFRWEILVVCATALAFGIFWWPGLYEYHWEHGGVYRVNRISGKVEASGEGSAGWITISATQPSDR
jgi:hypothetical protein